MILVQRGVHYLGMNIMMPKIPVLPEYENRINQFVRTQLCTSSMDDSVWYSTSTGRYRFNPVHGSVHVSAFGHDMMYSREYVHNIDSKVNMYLTQKIHPVLDIPMDSCVVKCSDKEMLVDAHTGSRVNEIPGGYEVLMHTPGGAYVRYLYDSTGNVCETHAYLGEGFVDHTDMLLTTVQRDGMKTILSSTDKKIPDTLVIEPESAVSFKILFGSRELYSTGEFTKVLGFRRCHVFDLVHVLNDDGTEFCTVTYSYLNDKTSKKIRTVLGVPVHKLNDPMMNGMLSYTTLPLPDKSWYDGKLRDRYV